jgi:hypothetical protein
MEVLLLKAWVLPRIETHEVPTQWVIHREQVCITGLHTSSFDYQGRFHSTPNSFANLSAPLSNSSTVGSRPNLSLTEEFREISPTDGKPYVTQYFERARFEYHPENKPPYDILLGLLGRTITQGREGEATFKRATAQTAPGTIYFAATGHNMPVQFSAYWRSHGGLPVYGYPISEAFTEASPTDGKPYLVQYFERNRLEYHPELPEPYRVSLGLLGVQVLQQRAWIR